MGDRGIIMAAWLMTDDNRDFTQFMRWFLGLYDIALISFTSCAKTIAWIDDAEQGKLEGELPEAAILNYALIYETGDEIAERLRSSPLFARLPIIMMSGYDVEAEMKSRHLIDHFFLTPADPDELTAFLDNFVQSRQ